MAEIEFADGKRTVDDPLVGLIKQATDGAPERFTFNDAMKRFNRVVEGNLLREATASVIRGHFSKPWEP